MLKLRHSVPRSNPNIIERPFSDELVAELKAQGYLLFSDGLWRNPAEKKALPILLRGP